MYMLLWDSTFQIINDINKSLMTFLIISLACIQQYYRLNYKMTVYILDWMVVLLLMTLTFLKLCEMTCVNLSVDPAVIDNGCSCHVVHTFHGSQTQTVLTRALLMTHPAEDSRMLVCAGEETSSGVSWFQCWLIEYNTPKYVSNNS